MTMSENFRLLKTTLAATLGVCALTGATFAAGASAPKLDEELQGIAATGVVGKPSAKAATSATPSFSARPSTARSDKEGRVQIDVEYDCSVSKIEGLLKDVGFKQNAIVKVAPLCVAEGWALPSALGSISEIPSVLKVRVPIYAAPSVVPTAQPFPKPQ